MATVTLSDISAALSLVHGRSMTNQINLNSVLANLLPVLPGEGKVLSWTAEFSGRSNAAPYAEGADMVDGDYDAEEDVDASLGWAQYRKGAKVSGLALAAAATNYKPETLTSRGNDLFMKDTRNAVNRLGLGIAEDLYAGLSAASPKAIVGLAEAVDSTGVYATIDPSSYPEWSSAENSIALASLSFDELRQKLHTPVYDACGYTPEFCVMGTAVFDKVAALYGPQRRYIEDIQVMRGGGQDGSEPRLIKLGAGVNVIEVDGIPYVRDRHCTANTIYAMNTQFLCIRQLPSANTPLDHAAINDLFQRMTDDPTVRLPTLVLEGMMGNNGGIKPYVDMIAKTGDAVKGQIKAYLQLELIRRNGLGKLTLT